MSFERSYPMMSVPRIGAFLLGGLLIPWVVYLLIASVEPRLTVRCERPGGRSPEASCEARESTLVVALATESFSPAGVTFARTGSTRLPVQLSGPAGPLSFGRWLRSDEATELVGQLDRFDRSTDGELRLSYERVSPRPFAFLTPLMLLIMLGPILGLGGRLRVVLDGHQLRVRRERPIGSRPWVSVTDTPGAPLRLEVRRLGGRWRFQGELWAEAGGRRHLLERHGAFDVLFAIANEVNEHVARRPG